MKQFAIHEANIDRLRQKMNRIQTKCRKYGCDFHYAEIGSEIREVEENGQVHNDKYIIVEAEGIAYINGWEFVGAIEHTAAGNIIRTTSDIQIPSQYLNCGPKCEHCNSNRHRKDTYLVKNIHTGEFKQVGSNCLYDYTQGMSAEFAASYISMFDSLIEGEYIPAGYKHKTYHDLRKVLMYGQEYCKVTGYVSTSAFGDSTKSNVIDALMYDANTAGEHTKLSVSEFRRLHGWEPESNLQYVEDLLQYILSCDEDSTFMNNLKVIAKLGYVDVVQLGYAVAMLPTYYRHLKDVERQTKRELQHNEDLKSEHVGDVGDKVTVTNFDMNCIAAWESSYGYYPEWVYRFKIVDNDGHIFMWDTSTDVDLDKDMVSISGKVKKHDVYDGVKQTWLTRCKIVYAETQPAPANNDAADAIAEFLEATN